MLEISSLSLSYGQHLALNDVSLSVGKGETIVILGANGAGKSSLLKAVAGMVKSAPGSKIMFNGEALTGHPAHEIVGMGIALVPEGRGVFPELTVEENLLLGANPARARAGEKERRARVFELFPKLAERRKQRVGTMSGGEQQMVAIGRALMSAPELLLLDEPSLGLAPIVVGELFNALRRIQDTGVGLLIVEQNVKASLAVADRGYLMEAGRIVGQGTAKDLMNDKAVQRAFLGATGGNQKTQQGSKTMDMVGLLIDGESRDASDGESFERINPITGDVATRAAAATADDARRAADAAAKAFPEWSATSPGARRKLLIAASEALRAKSDEIVEAMAEEIGATAGWAMFNIGLAADMLLEAAALTTQIAGEVIPSNRPGSLAMAVRQPAGVVLSMAPWNAPVILGVRSIATPLACGNTVVMKTSEICPRTHRLIVEAVQSAGLPKGVLNVISNAPDDAPEIVEALIAHPAIRRINFTGSTRVGRLIAETAGRHLKPVLLELGGKAPMIVLDDADLEQAVAAAAFGAYMNQGQICMSTERIVVDETIADKFCEMLTAKVKSLKAGDPREGNTPLGSVVDMRATQRIEELIKDAVDKGAVLAAGGSAEGTIIQATLLDRVTPAMRIYNEESFGPVVSVVRVGSVDEAIRVANDTEYGLAAAVFGKDVNRALGVARRIESGICHVNGPTVHDEAQMPFGGVKDSGFGRFGGSAVVDEFTELRWITVQRGSHPFPF